MGGSQGSSERLVAFGAELIEIHRRLREQLAALRGDVVSYLKGEGGRPRELKAHCLAFCSALGAHHTGEDAGAFPVLAGRFPELRPLIGKLEEDHQLVAGILR
ncbi:hemerythrin domain-containing protein [Amycolatopsis sp. NPDC051903]|uniref:hemerythrin domain-containing protein n=1 Tax=Amycolatopsis sp. NPDC051903 TaxID=3363936 RepID=UPI003798A2CF